jgi:hypothetical protein
MVIPYFYYYLSYFIYLLQVYIYFFQIKLFKWFVINIWVIIHIDTHFLELEYFNYDIVKPFKNSFFLCRFEALRTCFSIWITTTFCDMVKRHLKNSLRKPQEWIFKMKGYNSTLCIFCTKCDNNTKSRKVSEIRLKNK